ncbi:MAG: helix-turn-helix domain-containing protein [Erythrobacter sp.]
MDKGVPIRALSRGLDVLSNISRNGPISLMQIANGSDLPYATACRIVQTLVHEGLVEREVGRKLYRVTPLVQSLSTGFQKEDMLAHLSKPFLEELCEEIKWPVSIATRVGTRMVLRETTHAMTSLTFSNYYPGFTLPIAECATGKAYLAHCDNDERDTVIDGWHATDNETANVGLLLTSDEGALEQIRDQGYAMQMRNNYNAEPGKTSTIAVPVLQEDGHVLASLGAIYFASAMAPGAAAEQFTIPLKRAADAIGKALESSPEAVL